jgi:uncharacterized protein HemX
MTLQPIEGITPDMLWTALIVLVGVCGLIVLGDKVADVWRKHKARKKIASGPESQLADEISKKVMEKLEPRFADIDRKFANDKQLLETHTRQIGDMNKRVDSLETGQKAQCRGILALLNHELHNGNSDEMVEAKKEIDNYLIEK